MTTCKSWWCDTFIGYKYFGWCGIVYDVALSLDIICCYSVFDYQKLCHKRSYYMGLVIEENHVSNYHPFAWHSCFLSVRHRQSRNNQRKLSLVFPEKPKSSISKFTKLYLQVIIWGTQACSAHSETLARFCLKKKNKMSIRRCHDNIITKNRVMITYQASQGI